MKQIFGNKNMPPKKLNNVYNHARQADPKNRSSTHALTKVMGANHYDRDSSVQSPIGTSHRKAGSMAKETPMQDDEVQQAIFELQDVKNNYF